MFDLFEERRKRYKIKLKRGQIIYFTAFEEIIIKEKLNRFLRKSPGKEWGNKPMFKVMLDGVIQYLCLWKSESLDNSFNKTVSIIIGSEHERLTGSKYNIYYEVSEDNNTNSNRYDCFDEAFQDFRKRILSI